ncbi:MAG: division/cell wall cluster transcriptional repressor MraZ [Bacilli bacterium]|nr:division/cell wall cluster transcriptional repressor MraZ [Bacilli bacterium]MDD3896053.1 division/cell wall cluster transcriptional repressor MraZ [Bacilli bacterium]MDD4407890.1 division/cell wall cluster transcriptional repressor MraZ [Bacilli bacterium]
MLMGEFHHNIDDKGRLIIPSKFRTELGEKLIITRGLDKCLFIYSLPEWDKIVKRLKTLPFTNKDARNFTRFFLSGATECEFDRQGRINITSPLVSYADLTKECVVIGANDRLEIWSSSIWEDFLSNNEDNLADIAENLFTSGDYETL